MARADGTTMKHDEMLLFVTGKIAHAIINPENAAAVVDAIVERWQEDVCEHRSEAYDDGAVNQSFYGGT